MEVLYWVILQGSVVGMLVYSDKNNLINHLLTRIEKT